MAASERRVVDFEPGDAVDGVLLLKDRELRRTPKGDVYMACLLGDRSGTIDGRWWKATEESIRALSPGCFVEIAGKVQRYRGKLQLIVDEMERVEASAELFESLMPTTAEDIDGMWDELVEIMSSLKNRHLRRLVESFLADETLVERFKRAPAGTKLHHAVVGGLLEHTLQMLRLARAAAAIYKEAVREDILLTGVFLHDIGKTAELTSGGAFSYTVRGNLVGHIGIGVAWIEQRADELARTTGEPIPRLLLDLVEHLVISHHGSRDRGSPKPPMTREALLLHALDDLDTRMAMARETLAAEHDPTADFTHYHRVLDAVLFNLPPVLPGDEPEQD